MSQNDRLKTMKSNQNWVLKLCFFPNVCCVLVFCVWLYVLTVPLNLHVYIIYTMRSSLKFILKL